MDVPPAFSVGKAVALAGLLERIQPAQLHVWSRKRIQIHVNVHGMSLHELAAPCQVQVGVETAAGGTSHPQELLSHRACDPYNR